MENKGKGLGIGVIILVLAGLLLWSKREPAEAAPAKVEAPAEVETPPPAVVEGKTEPVDETEAEAVLAPEVAVTGAVVVEVEEVPEPTFVPLLPDSVAVSLDNSPVGATHWNWDIYGIGWRAGDSTEERALWKRSLDNVPIPSPAILSNIPAGWFPLRYRLNIYGTLPWGKGVLFKQQTAYPDRRNYREDTVPNYGSYLFNVVTRRLVKV